MAEQESADKKQKARRPTAKKRDLQNERQRRRNRSLRSFVMTAVRNLHTSIAQKEPVDALKTKLNLVYSLMDKGVKKGIFKVNKAARTKSRLSARCRGNEKASF